MIKTYRPTSEGQRDRKTLVRDVDRVAPLKSKLVVLKAAPGRSRGRISSRHREKGAKKLYRVIDFKRDKLDIPARVVSIEYDPNRGVNIALLNYADGDKRYILCPEGLSREMKVIASEKAEPIVGNALPLANIPLGAQIHNIEINPKAGGVLVRGAGNYALVMAKEGGYVNIKLPSGEIKRLRDCCYATIGALTNMELRNIRLGKAGRRRYLGWRPHVRGVSMANPAGDHPHAGKYRTSGIGMKSPKSPWGWITRGVKSRKRRRTDYTIVQGRKQK